MSLPFDEGMSADERQVVLENMMVIAGHYAPSNMVGMVLIVVTPEGASYRMTIRDDRALAVLNAVENAILASMVVDPPAAEARPQQTPCERVVHPDLDTAEMDDAS